MYRFRPALGRVLVGVLTVPAGVARAQPVITDLGVMPGGTFAVASGISGDGSTVVGQGNGTAGNRAFRWTAGTGMQSLGALPGFAMSYSHAVNADGSVVVGSSSSSNNTSRAFRWTAGGGMQSLGVLGTGSASTAGAVNSDGSVVAGFSYTSAFTHGRAFRWTQATGIQDLGVFTNEDGAGAEAITADGSVIAGYAYIDGYSRAGRWSASGLEDLGVLAGADSANAFALSADGSVVVGTSGDQFNLTYNHAARWTRVGNGWAIQDLGALAGSAFSQADAMSADGSIVVGSDSPPNGDRAALWTAPTGLVDHAAYLSARGTNLSGWTLSAATGISANGAAIAGYGTFDGRTRAFLITGVTYAPQCGGADFNHDGDTATDADIEAFFACLAGNCCAACGSADFNGDGDTATDADIEAFFRVLAGGSC